MSPYICQCIICGYHVFEGGSDASWKNEFRLVYSDAAGCAISGVGLYDDPSGLCIAPPQQEARWDDAGYDRPSSHAFGIMKLSEINGRHGFIMHDACWSLLIQAFHPRLISPERLYHVCNSMPFSTNYSGLLRWGHDYERMFSKDIEWRYPWDEYELSSRTDLHNPIPEKKINPFNSNDLGQLLAAPSEEPPANVIEAIDQPSSEQDRFSTLPPELCLAIATLLNTTDALAARLASRAFWPLFHDQQFWATRFRPPGERSWLFEASRHLVQVDFRSLYRSTCESRITYGLRNRQRVWRLAQAVADIMALEWTQSSDLCTTPNDELAFSEVSGHGFKGSGPFKSTFAGCRLSDAQLVYFEVPHDITGLSVSLVHLGDYECVAGIGISSKSRQEVLRLGYWGGNSREESMELATQPTGLVVAVGSRGIYALRCVSAQCDENPATSSQWLGNPNNGAKSIQLSLETPISSHCIRAAFDSMKLVSLGISDAVENIGRGLRASKLWYPDVPNKNLDLNEESRVVVDDGYNNPEWSPCILTHFGGPNGVYLRHLTGIRVRVAYNLRSIEFRYENNDHIPAQCRYLGREHDSLEVVEHDFPIDGPGGERMTGIEAMMTSYGTMLFVKVSTNRQRSCLFAEENSKETPITKQLDVKPGHTITGLYVVQSDSEADGLMSLGVVSELIPHYDAGHCRQPIDSIVSITRHSHSSSEAKPRADTNMSLHIGHMHCPVVNYAYAKLRDPRYRDSLSADEMWRHVLERYFDRATHHVVRTLAAATTDDDVSSSPPDRRQVHVERFRPLFTSPDNDDDGDDDAVVLVGATRLSGRRLPDTQPGGVWREAEAEAAALARQAARSASSSSSPSDADAGSGSAPTNGTQQRGRRPIYVMVGVGRYVRFYVMPPAEEGEEEEEGSGLLVPHHPVAAAATNPDDDDDDDDDGHMYEVERDEAAIDEILFEWREITRYY